MIPSPPPPPQGLPGDLSGRDARAGGDGSAALGRSLLRHQLPHLGRHEPVCLADRLVAGKLTGLTCCSALCSRIMVVLMYLYTHKVSDHSAYFSPVLCLLVSCVCVLCYACPAGSMLSAPASVLHRTFLFEFNDWSAWDAEDLAAGIVKTKS